MKDSQLQKKLANCSGVHLSPVNDHFRVEAATANCGTLMGPTSLVNVPSQNITNDLAMIDVFETMIRSPRLCCG